MNEHYFSEAPVSSFRERQIEVMLAGKLRRVTTAAGVFSPQQLDRGTAVLLRSVAAAAAEGHDQLPLLDLGCGWGAIALAAALTEPGREVWAVDLNERARQLTIENAQRLGLARVRVAAPAEVPAELSFGTIRSNPPIRVGKPVLHALLRQWLPRLAPGGAAQLVVAKHLGADSLQRWLTAEFPRFQVSRIARDHGFHVIQAMADPGVAAT